MHIYSNTQIHTLPNQVCLIMNVYHCDAFGNMHKPDKNCQRVWAWQHVCVCVSLIITENMHCPLQHSSWTPNVASIAFSCIAFSAEQTNTQTVSDREQWTRQAFRLLMLTVEGTECKRLQEGHASFNRQRGETHTPFYFYLYGTFILIMYNPAPNLDSNPNP